MDYVDFDSLAQKLAPTCGESLPETGAQGQFLAFTWPGVSAGLLHADDVLHHCQWLVDQLLFQVPYGHI